MRHFLWLASWTLSAGLGFAQPAAPASGRSQAVSPIGIAATASREKSPVDYFRQLLDMSAAERERALAGLAEAKRKVLQAKIQEYQLLPKPIQETRLQLVELHYYLQPLMKLPPAKRPDKLAIIPEKDRKLIEDRLREWDQLPQPLRDELLDNEVTMHYFLRLESGTPRQREELLKSFPADSRKSLEDKIEKWRALPTDRRQKMYQHFNLFFEMPPKEKEKTLEALPDDERQQMEKSLRTFEKLRPDQRQMVIESFRKFSDLTKEERTQFLKNAERWQELTPRERETWRNLVTLLPAHPAAPLPPPLGQKTVPGVSRPALPGTVNSSNPPPAVPGSQGQK